MSVTLDQAVVVTEGWSVDQELENSQLSFQSIEELFDLILHMSNQGDIDKIVLKGKDDSGEAHMMVLSFNYILGG